MSTDLLEGRVAELEARAQRLVLAGDDRDGWGAWRNLLELRLMQQQDNERALLTEVVATLQRDFQETVKAAIETALARRIRGTYDPKAEYCANDLVAKDGASFVAKRNDPGPLPGDGWQLLARQGQRGIAGERGAPGRDAPTITSWVVDREHFVVIRSCRTAGKVRRLSCARFSSKSRTAQRREGGCAMNDPVLLEARIRVQVALLRELAAKTALEWTRATARERYANSGNPILQALARRMPPLLPPSVD